MTVYSNNTGIISGVTEVIQVPYKIQELFIKLVKSAKDEVSLVLPTTNAFYREERLGIIQMLKEAALDHNVSVRILTPSNVEIEKKIERISALLDHEGQNLALEMRPIETTRGAAI